MPEQTGNNSQPLQILVVTSRPLLTEEGNAITLLDVAEERRRIEESLKHVGNAQAHFVPEATTGKVQAALNAGCDVAHFTGHGTDDGRLVLEDGYGVERLLTKEETAKLFAGNNIPLVILSACFSESVGRELLAAGVPAVVAIDATTPIADKAAIIFAEHFYNLLARQKTIQEAFDRAQNAVALDAEVGDTKLPLDRRDDNDTWSSRFKLLGKGNNIIVPSAKQAHQPEEKPPYKLDTLTNFFGRAKEIVEIVEAFEKRKQLRVALCGTGGIGKTALSKAAAWWYLDRERANTVLWTSAALDQDERDRLRDLSSLLSVAMRYFGLPVTEQSLFEEQKRVVREFLETNRAVVVLDNWETIATEHRRELWNYIKSLSNDVRVIITSREELPPKETSNIQIKTLDLSDALQLFINIAVNTDYFEPVVQRILPMFLPYAIGKDEADYLDKICERLSGYPLALEVTAGQTVSRMLKDIWEDLRQYPMNVLESVDELTGEPRGIWTSLDMSYNALSPEEQKLFRQLCVFLAPAAFEDIAAVTETSDRRLLDKLVRRSLVQMSEGAYSLLPVLKMYAESKLADVEQNIIELHRRAISYYYQKRTLQAALIASEHLFELATRYQERKAAETFAGYVQSFYYDLVTQGYWFEARQKNEQMIIIAQSLEDHQLEERAIFELGTHYQQVGKYSFASRLYKQSLKIAEELGDKTGITNSLHGMGNLAYLQDDYSKAMELYEKSLKISEERRDKQGIAISLGQLGRLAQIEEQWKDALVFSWEAFVIFYKLHDPSHRLAFRDIARLSEAVGREQFISWLNELTDTESAARLLEAIDSMKADDGNESEQAET